MKLSFTIIITLMVYPIINTLPIDQICQFITDVAREVHGTCIDIMSSPTDPNDLISKQIKMNLIKKRLLIGEMRLNKYERIQKDYALSNISCYRPVIFGLADEFNQKRFGEVIANGPIFHNVWLWLLENENHTTQFFNSLLIPFDALVLAAIPDGSTSISIFEIYRVKENNPLRINFLGNWTMSDGVEPQNLIVRTRLDLEKINFKVAAVENWPVSTYRHLLDPNIPVDGYFVRIWMELAAILNFTSEFIAPQMAIAGTFENGVWNGVVEMAHTGVIDVIIAELNINADRINVLDFLHPLVSSRYQMFYQPHYVMDLKAVFRPLNGTIWLLLVSWIIVGGILLNMFGRISAFIVRDDPFREKSLCKYSMFVFQALCNQGNHVVPKTTSSQILFLLCYLVPSVIIPSYSASLISSLTQREPFLPYKTLNDLLDYNVPIITGKKTSEYGYFKGSSDPVHQKVFNNLIEPVHDILLKNETDLITYQGAIKMVCVYDRYALFAVESSVEMKMATHHPEERWCSLVKFPQSFTPAYQSIALKRRSPYTHVLRHQTLRLFEFGMVARQRRIVSPWKRSEEYRSNEEKLIFVNIFQVAEIFFTLLWGIVASVLIFFGELFCKFMTQKN